MLVVADADIIRNDISLTPQGALISRLDSTGLRNRPLAIRISW